MTARAKAYCSAKVRSVDAANGAEDWGVVVGISGLGGCGDQLWPDVGPICAKVLPSNGFETLALNTDTECRVQRDVPVAAIVQMPDRCFARQGELFPLVPAQAVEESLEHRFAGVVMRQPGALVDPQRDDRKSQPAEPLVFVLLFSGLCAKVDQSRLGADDIANTLGGIGINQQDAHARHTFFVRGDTAFRVTTAANFDVAVGEVLLR